MAPTAALEALRELPTWGWALVAALGGSIAGSFLALPAYHHFLDAAMPAMLAKNPQIAKLPAAEQQRQIASILTTQHTFANFNFVLAPLGAAIAFALQALVMLGARAAGHGEGGFRRFWALACNAGIVGSGLGSLALGLICTLRGPASFNAQSDLQTALPSLALVVPSAPPVLATFLGTINVFFVWSAVLLALGMIRTARIRPWIAWPVASLFVILPGLFAAYGVARAG